MKRATRVPASSVLRIKSASNMIAKWYQSATTALPPSEPAKICAIPTASEGAPPVRENSDVSPIVAARWFITARLTGNPQEVIFVQAAAALPTTPAGELIAK